jgi:2',3'-cyclic-nucleotide 2'-phosphodiesterase (5'-nucleotidase family)
MVWIAHFVCVRLFASHSFVFLYRNLGMASMKVCNSARRWLRLLLVARLALAGGEVTVSFIHINDHHSHLNENTFDIGAALIPDGLSVQTKSIRIKYGGFPRVVGLMKKMEKEALAVGNQVVKLHAGDAITGTLYYSEFGPDVDAAVLNEAGFEALTIGNHEFDGVRHAV